MLALVLATSYYFVVTSSSETIVVVVVITQTNEVVSVDFSMYWIINSYNKTELVSYCISINVTYCWRLVTANNKLTATV